MSLNEIKQKWMEDFEVVFGDETETVQESEFSQLLDEGEDKDFIEGEVYDGKVIHIGNDYVMIDIGYKHKRIFKLRWNFKN